MSLSVEELDQTVRSFFEGRGEVVSDDGYARLRGRGSWARGGDLSWYIGWKIAKDYKSMSRRLGEGPENRQRFDECDQADHPM